jgi:hypothetical protein
MTPLFRARVLPTLLSALFLAVPALAGPPSGPAGKKSGAALPPIYDTELLGKPEIRSKIELGMSTNRPILIDFGTNDCDPCRIVNQAIHEPKFFRELIKQFVPVLVDVSPGTVNAELLKEYSIDPKKGLPVFVLLDNEGKFREATTKGEIVAAAKKGKEAVQEWILDRFERPE